MEVKNTIHLLKLAAAMLSSENWNEVFGESRHIKKDVGTLTEANSDHCP